MNTTDTQFDRLAAVTQEAVDALKAAIERAEAAELQLSREAMQVAELMLEVRTLRKQRDLFWVQRDEFRAELQVERDASNQRLTEIYDRARKAEKECAALQARIDAGVRVWGKDLGNGEWCWSYTEYHTIDTHTAILIDSKPIDHLADPGKMVDDDRKGEADSKQPNRRKGDRRVDGSWEYCSCPRFKAPPCSNSTDYCWRPSGGYATFFHDNRRDPSGANERRKNK